MNLGDREVDRRLALLERKIRSVATSETDPRLAQVRYEEELREEHNLLWLEKQRRLA